MNKIYKLLFFFSVLSVNLDVLSESYEHYTDYPTIRNNMSYRNNIGWTIRRVKATEKELTILFQVDVVPGYSLRNEIDGISSLMCLCSWSDDLRNMISQGWQNYYTNNAQNYWTKIRLESQNANWVSKVQVPTLNISAVTYWSIFSQNYRISDLSVTTPFVIEVVFPPIRRGLEEITIVDYFKGNRFEGIKINNPAKKGIQTGLTLLKDSLGKEIQPADENMLLSAKKFKADTIYSQSTDTLLKIMMHRSDNFYADQCLAMVGQQRFQKMDEEGLIREMLSNELAGFPQKPTWVDGSGLSRYNLFSPDDMVYILDKIKTEQPWERIKTIFPKAGEGTLSMYKSSNDVYIYAKTGSMGGVLALSGYLYTQKKKWLIFSIMIDNSKAPNAKIRNQINEFLLKTAALY